MQWVLKMERLWRGVPKNEGWLGSINESWVRSKNEWSKDEYAWVRCENPTLVTMVMQRLVLE